MADADNEAKAPEEFICPITQEIMVDPVIGSDGVSYERAAIVEALLLKAESPMTRAPMTVDQLATNYALKGLIEKWRQDHAGARVAIPAKPVGHAQGAGQALPSDGAITLKTAIAPHPTSKALELIKVTATPPAEGSRRPVVVIALLDVSGSMSLDAAPQGQDAAEVQGFSRLDLVKHSMKTVIKVLTDRDYLSIITFSDRAETRMEPRLMAEVGQSQASTVIDSLEANGGTNIWDALRVGIDVTKQPLCKGKDVVLLLLTDGEPTINPPKGIVETLKVTLKNIENVNFSINSFGFGYKLDSLLLDDIARLGNGSFGFIPDCSMVGTIFINFLANSLTTRLSNARMVLEGTAVEHVFMHKASPSSGASATIVPIGAIRYGQKRTLLVARKKTADAKPIKVTLEAISADGKSAETIAETTEQTVLHEVTDDVFESFVIQHSTDVLYELAHMTDFVDVKAKAKVNGLKDIINKHDVQHRTEAVKDFMLDIESPNASEGQISKAISRIDWFERWGINHLLSFTNAHRYEQCANFKDKSLQSYGGAQFKKIQDEANEIFIKLPPPTPAPKFDYSSYSSYGSSPVSASAVPTRPVDMSAFMNSRGICFDGQGLVSMADGSLKRVCELRKGDRVGAGVTSARVIAVVQTIFTDDLPVEVVNINGVLVTPWHPVKLNGEWVFPADVGRIEQRPLTSVYNLVLSESHTVMINGVELVTMAHEMNRESAVLAHPYFGTKRVVEDLSKFPGWKNGHVILNNAVIERDAQGLICAIRDCPAQPAQAHFDAAPVPMYA